MGAVSNLTPLDVQLQYKGGKISAQNAQRFFERSKCWFANKSPVEAPYPENALTDQLDPYLMEEWGRLMETSIDYAKEFLDMVGYDDAVTIAGKLVFSFPSHGYVINAERAEAAGLNIEHSSDHQRAWDVMRHWLGQYVFEQEASHCIRYVLQS